MVNKKSISRVFVVNEIKKILLATGIGLCFIFADKLDIKILSLMGLAVSSLKGLAIVVFQVAAAVWDVWAAFVQFVCVKNFSFFATSIGIFAFWNMVSYPIEDKETWQSQGNIARQSTELILRVTILVYGLNIMIRLGDPSEIADFSLSKLAEIVFISVAVFPSAVWLAIQENTLRTNRQMIGSKTHKYKNWQEISILIIVAFEFVKGFGGLFLSYTYAVLMYSNFLKRNDFISFVKGVFCIIPHASIAIIILLSIAKTRAQKLAETIKSNKNNNSSTKQESSESCMSVEE